ncbi:MAG TPA: hypothetical protein VK900_15510 [Anaerolineales bacterium]|nr:hypothetical protein [Anaerolineales bacterium]
MAKLDSDDLKAIKDLIEVTIDEAIERNGLATQDHIGNLPNKDEFYGTMDIVMGELKAIREEVSVLGHQVADHADRLERIETSLVIASD